MPAGAPLGNRNGFKGRIFSDALRKAIIQRDLDMGRPPGETLRLICLKWLEKAEDGDISSAREIRDTLQGKPALTIEDSEGGLLRPLVVGVLRFVDQGQVIDVEPKRLEK